MGGGAAQFVDEVCLEGIDVGARWAWLQRRQCAEDRGRLFGGDDGRTHFDVSP